VRAIARMKQLSLRTEQAYVAWIKRYILFHGKRHPRYMGELEIRSFISDLAVNGNVSASTQTVALSALLFLYRDVLQKALPYVSKHSACPQAKTTADRVHAGRNKADSFTIEWSPFG
jgi:Phage integrase, N-terminal SAM-like domain